MVIPIPHIFTTVPVSVKMPSKVKKNLLYLTL